jgi:sigma-B regulation protein RsbU (phosphoserine phosphatase)
MALLAFYILAGIGLLVYRTRTLENRSMRRELLYLVLAIGPFSLSMIALMYLWPLINHFSYFMGNYIHVPMLLQLITVHYAVQDIRRMDMRYFYLRVRSWLLPFALLVIPVGAGLYYSRDLISRNLPAATGITIALLLYMALGYRFFKPLIDTLFNRDYLRLLALFNGFFEKVKELGQTGTEDLWDRYYKTTIAPFGETLKIECACFYLFDRSSNSFHYVYGYGGTPPADSMENDSPLVLSLLNTGHIVDRSLLYTEELLFAHRPAVLDLFDRAGIELALPFFHVNGELFGILLLGSLPGKGIYSNSMISAFEIYRIQFQRHLAGFITLKEVRSSQTAEHDRLVVRSIKKKIRPATIKQAPGMRISSFYLDNSESGGDYFSSLQLSSDRICLFLADTAYTGVDSGILALELHSALQAMQKKSTTPERVLNGMNWIISSSGYHGKYAPAVALVFRSPNEIMISDAAHNPLIIYNPRSDSFTAHESTGVPLGVEDNHVYESRTMSLPKGSLGILYSDGFTSAINDRGETYSIERAKGLIHQNRFEKPAVIARKVFDDFNSHTGDRKQINDVTFIIFKIVDPAKNE